MKLRELCYLVRRLKDEVGRLRDKRDAVVRQASYANGNATIAIWGGGSDEGPEHAVIVSNNGFDWEKCFVEYYKYLEKEIERKQSVIDKIEGLVEGIECDEEVKDVWNSFRDLSRCDMSKAVK